MEIIFRTTLHIVKVDAVAIVPIHSELTTQEVANFYLQIYFLALGCK